MEKDNRNERFKNVKVKVSHSKKDVKRRENIIEKKENSKLVQIEKELEKNTMDIEQNNGEKKLTGKKKFKLSNRLTKEEKNKLFEEDMDFCGSKKKIDK